MDAAVGVTPWHAGAALAVAAVVLKLAISDGGRHPASLTLAQTVVLALLLALAASGRLRLDRLTVGLGGVVLAAALTSVWSVRPEASLRELLLWLTYLGLGAVAAWSLRSTQLAIWFADGLVAVAAWLCLVALFMFWGNAGDASIRWSSTFYWPNPFAAFLVMALPVALARMMRAGGIREAAAQGAAVILLGTALVFTGSRGVWIALAAALPVMAVVLRPRSWGTAMRRVAVVVVLCAAAVTLLGRIGPAGGAGGPAGRAASIADPADPSVIGRLNFWGSALRIFADHPVVGTGPGTFGAAHPAYQRDPRFYARDPHNLYLQFLAEMGLVGAAALILLLVSLAFLWIAALGAAVFPEHYSVVAGAGVSLLAFLVHSAVDMDWSYPANPAMAFALVGLLGAAVGAGEAQAGRVRRPGWRPLSGTGRAALAVILLAAVAAVQAGQAAHTRYVAGQAAARGDRWSDAAALYAEARGWNPLSPLYARAEALAALQTSPPDRLRAERALRDAMALDRMSAAHLIQLASVFTGTPAATEAQLAEAEALLRRALALDPFNRPGAYRDLARLYIRQGRRTEAAAVYRDAVRRYLGRGVGRGSLLHLFLWPEIGAVVLEAAEFMVEEGRAAEAEQALRAVLEEDPAAGWAALRLAQLYGASGRTGEARRVLEEAARRLPDDDRIRRALSDLRDGAP